jgi:hypothetical protein
MNRAQGDHDGSAAIAALEALAYEGPSGRTLSQVNVTIDAAAAAGAVEPVIVLDEVTECFDDDGFFGDDGCFGNGHGVVSPKMPSRCFSRRFTAALQDACGLLR